MDCLDDNIAAEFASGSLPRAAITRVESHLAGCRDCRMLVAALAQDASEDSQAATHKHDKISQTQPAGPGQPARTFTVGDRVGRYLVLSTLGAGGMGVVFSAYDPQLDRKVALKLLRGNLGVTTKEARTRLRREAQAIAQLSHPNVVGVYDVGTTTDDDLYIAMEFVEGDTLTHWLKAYPRTWREILDVFRQAARGLFAAHSVNLLHRDFKPDNVLVGGDSRVRVTDFGLARSVLAPVGIEDRSKPAPTMAALSVELTATGTVLGTPRYMPPEQLVGPDIDARSDQFSFCIALYEALYGQHPLPGATAISMLEKGERALSPPANSDVPLWVHKVVARGLERDRAKRFPTMAELIAELTPKQVRSRARVAAMMGAMVLLIGGATGAAIKWGTVQPTLSSHDGDWAVTELNRLEMQLRTLKDQREQLEHELETRPNIEEFNQLRVELEQKNRELETIYKQVATLQHDLVVARAAARPTAPSPLSHNAAVERAAQNAFGDIQGCLREWSERAGAKAGTEHADVTLLVKTVVSAEGRGHDSSVSAVEGNVEAVVQSRVLQTCIGPAVERQLFPVNPQNESLDLELTITWMNGQLGMTAGVRRHLSLVDL